MENRYQKLAQVLGKNDTWKWLGPGNLLGDKTITQYSGLKIFIRYIIDNRVAILDKREDRGVNFIATGDNPLCRNFVDYLRTKAEETKDEKEKQKFIWMINRSEGMLEMKEKGQMNDGILLAYANAFFALGEQVQPKIEVNENSIVGLLENGFAKSREGDPGLGKIIDGIEGRKIAPTPPTLAPAPTTPVAPTPPAAPTAPVAPTAPTAPAVPTVPAVLTPTVPAGATVPEKPEESLGSETLFGPLKPESKPEIEPKPKPEPKPGKVLITKQKSTEKKVLKTAKLKQVVVPTGEGIRKKQPKKQVIQKKEPAKGGAERKKEQPIQKPIARPTRKTEKLPTERRQAVPSGGWRIAKKAMKYSAGSIAGGGIIGWMATSASEAKAATLAFINLLF